MINKINSNYQWSKLKLPPEILIYLQQFSIILNVLNDLDMPPAPPPYSGPATKRTVF